MKNNLKEWIIEQIKENIYNYEGEKVYGCDLGYTIFESANIDGSYTYSTYEAIEWIKKYFDDLGEIIEELKFQFGNSDYIPNIFDEPEKFQVVILLECASYVLSRTEFIDKNWNSEFKLTKNNIKKIINQLKNESYEFYN